MTRLRQFKAGALAAGLLGLAAVVSAQDEAAANDMAQANNALAYNRAFALHNYYIGELTGSDENANQFWLRLAQPFSIGETSWLMRASLPINTYPVQPELEHQTGLGDLNVLAAYLFDVGNPGITFGLGPQITMDTATDDGLGSGKWSAGVMNYMFNATLPTFQWAYLLTWQASFAGDGDRADVNVATFQPNAIFQLGGGTYLRSSAIMTYDFENDGYSVPLGLGLGQVLKRGKTIYNLFLEPQWTVADEGEGWPEWQVFLGLNILLL
jgi:hypothetical protein